MDKQCGILAFVPDVWGDVWQPRHHVLSGLSRHFKVLWVSQPTYVEKWRQTGIKDSLTGRGVRKVSERFWAYAPRLPADYKRHYAKRGIIPDCFRRYNAWWERRHVAQIKRLLERMGIRRVILYIWRPEFARYAERIPHELLCYHIDDEYSFSSAEDVPTSNEEIELLRKADHVFIHSKSLLDKKGHINPKTRYVPNGVDFDLFQEVMHSDAPEPSDLRGIPHPRIGYVGYIKRHIDLPLLLAIARQRRDWSLVLVGPVRDQQAEIAGDVAALRKEPNVHFLGGKSSRDVAPYIKGFDVCLMCYRKTHYTKYIYPMKLHEYLACGRPVVATQLENLEEFANALTFAATPSQWLDAIAAAADSPTPEQVTLRVSLASRNSWSARVELIAAEMQKGLLKPVAETAHASS